MQAIESAPPSASRTPTTTTANITTITTTTAHRALLHLCAGDHVRTAISVAHICHIMPRGQPICLVRRGIPFDWGCLPSTSKRFSWALQLLYLCLVPSVPLNLLNHLGDGLSNHQPPNRVTGRLLCCKLEVFPKMNVPGLEQPPKVCRPSPCTDGWLWPP